VEISQCRNQMKMIKDKLIKDKKHVFLNYPDSLIKEITSSIVLTLILEHQYQKCTDIVLTLILEMYRWRQKCLLPI